MDRAKDGATKKKVQTTLDTIITKKARKAPSDCDGDLQVPIPNDTNQSDFIACTSHPVESFSTIPSSAMSDSDDNASHVHEKDIGNFYNRVSLMSDAEKYDLQRNVWKPPQTFSFPKNSAGRKFQYRWLESFPWLAYSELLNEVFCIHCVLFGGESSHNSSKLT
ncbi:MAG: hypothetical protein GY786_25200, partial [Proteobacteria bacterium]|nr:hypothetical protein [Pseudomonadota bacterium]